MKELITALLNSYPNTDNRPTEFDTYIDEQCKKTFKSNFEFARHCSNNLQNLNSLVYPIVNRVKQKKDSPVKNTIEEETKLEQQEIYNKIIQNRKKNLNNTIEDIINNFKDVNNFDLTDINLQERIIKSLKQFQPKDVLHKEFHDALLTKLPEALKVYGLKLITEKYLYHLDTKIAGLIPRNFKPCIFNKISSRTEQYVNLYIDGKIQTGNTELQIAIHKYNVISIMQFALTNQTSNKTKLDHFNSFFVNQKDTIAQSCDSYAKTFLKKALDFLTAYKFRDWLWNSRGKEVGKQIDGLCKVKSTHNDNAVRRLFI